MCRHDTLVFSETVDLVRIVLISSCSTASNFGAAICSKGVNIRSQSIRTLFLTFQQLFRQLFIGLGPGVACILFMVFEPALFFRTCTTTTTLPYLIQLLSSACFLSPRTGRCIGVKHPLTISSSRSTPRAAKITDVVYLQRLLSHRSP